MRINYGKKEAEQKKSNCKIKTPEKKHNILLNQLHLKKYAILMKKEKTGKRVLKILTKKIFLHWLLAVFL